MNNYLILGGCGFIGRHLVEEILKNDKDANVTIVDIFEDEYFKKVSNITQIKKSFSQILDFDNLISNANIIYHLISTTTPNDFTDKIKQDFDDTIMPTIKLLESISKYKDKKFIFVSSGGTVYGECQNIPIKENENLNPICTYAVQKVVIEKYIEAYAHLYNMKYIICRLANPYGIGQNIQKKQGIIPIFVHKILKGESLQIWGDGESIRDYIYIDDAVNALFLLSQYNGKKHIFNVGSGIGYSINQIIELIMKELDIQKHIIEYLPERMCDVKRNILDISNVTMELGWKPKVCLEKGLQKILELLQR